MGFLKLVCDGQSGIYEVNDQGKIPFSDKPFECSKKTFDKVFGFAYAMAFEDGYIRGHRSGGSAIRNSMQRFANTFQGKLAEFCVVRHLKNWGVNADDPDIGVYGQGVSDSGYDVLANGNKGSIKSAAYFSNLLLLETKDYDHEATYLPTGVKNRFIIFARVKPKIERILRDFRLYQNGVADRQELYNTLAKALWLVDCPGFVTIETFKQIIRDKMIIPRGSCLNTSCIMDADNYYLHCGDMQPFSEAQFVKALL